MNAYMLKYVDIKNHRLQTYSDVKYTHIAV